MKKLLLIVFAIYTFSSCEEYQDGLYSGPDQVAFAVTSSTGLYLEEAGAGDDDRDSLEVQLIGAPSATARTVGFALDATSNEAVEGLHFDFVSAGGTIQIPANSNIAYIYFNVKSDNIAFGEDFDLVVNLSSDDVAVSGTLSTISHNMSITCTSDLAGTYDAVSSGSSTDPCVATNGNVVITNLAYSTVTITEATGVGNYVISESFAGLYDEWYVACYGYASGENNPLTEVCGSISGAWTDAFSATQFAVTGSVDGAGVITISWTNAFGDQGSTVLTPQ